MQRPCFLPYHILLVLSMQKAVNYLQSSPATSLSSLLMFHLLAFPSFTLNSQWRPPGNQPVAVLLKVLWSLLTALGTCMHASSLSHIRLCGTHVSCTGRWILFHWATREAPWWYSLWHLGAWLLPLDWQKLLLLLFWHFLKNKPLSKIISFFAGIKFSGFTSFIFLLL